MTVAAVVASFISQNKPTGRAAEERHKILREFVAEYGDRHIAKMRPADLAFWINAHESWRSDWTRLRIFRTVFRPFNWALRLQLIDRNPFAGLHFPQGERGRPMSEAHFRTLLRNSDPCFRRVLIALRFNDIRPGELREVEREHIDAERQCAVMTRHKTWRTRKDHKPRLVVFHPVVWRLVLWLLRRQPHGRFIFLNSKGRPWTRSAIDLRLWRMRKRLGIPADVKLHSCRHSFGRCAALNGVGIATIAEMIGHTTLIAAKYYVDLYGQTDHIRAGMLKAAGNAVRKNWTTRGDSS